jgi:zinc transport system substrate-binding protein
MTAAVNKISEEISKIDPENSEFYKNNSDALKKDLQKLDSELKNTLSNLKNKGFYIYHPSFGYFADEYGLTMYALEEDGKKATARRIVELVDSAEKNGVKVIFYQAEIDSAQVESFAREINGESLQINPLAYDYLKNLEMIGETFKKVLNNEN